MSLQTRRGDRFWYENYFAPSGFEESQLNEIRRTTLARVICDNTELDALQPNVFSLEDAFESVQL
jgi:peroxidase